jgi:23S rRNA pseudouridine1911/1915/1917 synthase
MMNNLKKFSYTVYNPGARLDKYVSEVCQELTRSQAEKLIDQGTITVNGETARRGMRLAISDKIDIVIPPPAATELVPEDVPLKIIYEDNDLMVIDKPAGVTVYPAPGHPEHTLINYILSHYPPLAEMSGSPRPGVVHRLDKDTSGLMIVAKNPKAQLKLAEQFSSHTVLKIYTVLVKGHLSPEHGIIEAPIGRDPHNRQKMAIVANGRPATTEYTVRQYYKDYTLLDVIIHTGRTHQIRVHLQAIGFPVAGDAAYGIRFPFLERQFLHAHKLGFRHPTSGEWAEFSSPLPPDLESALKRLVKSE